ncbi:MAG TPA: PIN domain-containing protein [Thermoanaerobaculia bacterium]|nr:PIN domain-containing protein [Thermoanaerobaculia bacterium]
MWTLPLADFFNAHASAEAATLEALIREEADVVTCGVIASEVLQGIRRTATLPAIEEAFRDMEWLTPMEPQTYLQAAALFRGLRARGRTVRSTIDCLIARLAEENDVLLLHKDRDLALILESGLVSVKALPLV